MFTWNRDVILGPEKISEKVVNIVYDVILGLAFWVGEIYKQTEIVINAS